MKRWWHLLTIILLGLSISLGYHGAVNAQIPPGQLVQKAEQQYQSGNFQQSIKFLEQAQGIYQSQGENLQQAQVVSLTSLAQQQIGEWELARQNIAASFALISSIQASNSKTQVLAQIWNTRGHFQFLTGKHNEALEDWKTAEALYREIENSLGVSGSLLDQAQALEKMGFYRRSCNRVLEAFNHPNYNCADLTATQLTKIIQETKTQAYIWQIKGLNSIGNSLLLMGKLLQAQAFIEADQTIVQSLPNPPPQVAAKLTFSLGNIYKAIAQQERERENWHSFAYHSQEAIKYFQQLDQYQSYPHIVNANKLPAQLNQLSLYIISEKWAAAQELANSIELYSDNQLNPNFYAQVKFAHSIERLKQADISLKYSWQDIADIYLNIIHNTEKIKNSRIQSYALGYLGSLQQERKNLKLDVTPDQLIQQALLLAQAEHAPEIAYRWQWKLGQIYRHQGKRSLAISSYQAALASLRNLRSDLVSLTKEVQFDFREQIEPVYREFADLLLEEKSPSNQDLETARNVIEALQLAELDNYFQDACLTFEPKSIDQIDKNAAIIYTIVLPDRLEVIMATSDSQSNEQGQVFSHHTQAIPQEKLETTVRQLRQYITEPDRLLEVQQLSAELYDWLIKPLIADLTIQQPKTLVFVLDNILQTVPMSALYDGKKYLIEKYAIALTPGLRLLNPQKSFSKPSFLAGGVSEPLQVDNQKFSALDNVKNELNIFSRFNSQILLNTKFTPENLLNKLNLSSASRIHLATHGQFSSNPNKTFLLLWRKLLTIQDFSTLLLNRTKAVSEPIDLLVLSACETASGDRRSALGLAGIAVRSGSITTVATLWQVKDNSTAAFMNYFYQQLQNKQNTKAEALQKAQLQLWQTADRDWKVPAFWSSYIMLGNWQ